MRHKLKCLCFLCRIKILIQQYTYQKATVLRYLLMVYCIVHIIVMQRKPGGATTVGISPKSQPGSSAKKGQKRSSQRSQQRGECVCMCLCKFYKTTSMTGGLLKIIKQHNYRTLKDYMAENNIFQITFKI